jgi:hypothetical protein
MLHLWWSDTNKNSHYSPKDQSPTSDYMIMEYASGEWWVCFISHICNRVLILDRLWSVSYERKTPIYVLNYWHIEFLVCIFTICNEMHASTWIRWINGNQPGLFDAQKLIVFLLQVVLFSNHHLSYISDITQTRRLKVHIPIYVNTFSTLLLLDWLNSGSSNHVFWGIRAFFCHE